MRPPMRSLSSYSRILEKPNLFSRILENQQWYVGAVSPRQHSDPSVGNIARRFNQARLHAKLTLNELSKKSKCAMSTLSGMSIGDRMPRIDSVAKVARALGVSPAWLAYGEGTPPDWLPPEKPSPEHAPRSTNPRGKYYV